GGGHPLEQACLRLNAVLFQELRKLVRAKVGQDQFSHLQGRCTPLSGEPDHLVESSSIHQDIDRLVLVPVTLEPFLCHVTPRAPGLDIENEWSGHRCSVSEREIAVNRCLSPWDSLPFLTAGRRASPLTRRSARDHSPRNGLPGQSPTGVRNRAGCCAARGRAAG